MCVRTGRRGKGAALILSSDKAGKCSANRLAPVNISARKEEGVAGTSWYVPITTLALLYRGWAAKQPTVSEGGEPKPPLSHPCQLFYGP